MYAIYYDKRGESQGIICGYKQHDDRDEYEIAFFLSMRYLKKYGRKTVTV
ncbi:hypothetical protein GCM10008018_06810 [Paenibacillus marchantiophytorum]|uniref:Phage protein n=1 Tax=Paenibacillus marchantiophytorum TaxID=1619310 RepID=A0ABQ2BRW7_9BACL|nr:hypothetical protein GCM10008018_06810 [Paenibacillus marchantiophytorum]